MERLLADLILSLHFAFILFVVAGQLLISIGLWRHWQWVRNFTFRILHLLAIGYVVAEAWLGVSCPLTVWENRLRRAAGEQGYDDGFIAYWLHALIFYEAPPWVFTLIYTLFFLLVVMSWIRGRPRRRR